MYLFEENADCLSEQFENCRARLLVLLIFW